MSQMVRPSLSLALLVLLALVTACSRPPAKSEGAKDAAPGGPEGVPEAPGNTTEPQPEEPPWFEEITRHAGIEFIHDAGFGGQYFMPEMIGPGAAFFDFDNDGLLDIYLVNGGRGLDRGLPGETPAINRLLRQGRDGIFRDVTGQAGVGDGGYGMGCAVGDLDNDGDLDLYVTNYGPDVMYLNDGAAADGGVVFRDITASSGITGSRWSTSAGFFDADGDGLLDLFVTHYLVYDGSRPCRTLAGQREYCGPESFRGIPDVLYRNLGDGRFEDHSRSAGISHLPGKGLGLLLVDFNADGLVDVYVANDAERNALWINLGGGRFEDQAVVLGAAVDARGLKEASMGVATGDVDGDGDLDLFMTHLIGETNTLYLNHHNLAFEDRTGGSGLGASSLPYTGFGTGFFDADLDGDLDLAIANGKVRLTLEPTVEQGSSAAMAENPVATDPVSEGVLPGYAEPNLFFENVGEGRFQDASWRTGTLCSRSEVSRGLIFGDVDRDGDLDLLLTQVGAAARLYRNDVPSPGHWLTVRAFDPEVRRDAIGALVRVEADSGSWIRPVTHTYSYLASSEATAHFGLGVAERVERVVIRWPGGEEESFGPLAVDQAVILNKGEGER